MLASASPRRRELLSLLGIPFEVRPAEVAEEFGDGTRPEIVARRLAREKAEAARLLVPGAPILAADTVVVLDGALLGKPRDERGAAGMLRLLRGRSHDVITAVALIPRSARGILARHSVTSVTMRPYTDAEVAAWTARGNPFDKAGGYAIQDASFRPVEYLDGCYCNVMGLPLWPVTEMLRKAGVAVTSRAEDLLPQCSSCPLRPPS